MPPPRETVGERISGLEAKFDSFEKYTHDKWHDLAQILQPLALLPERITREVGKIEKAVEPMSKEVAELGARVDVLERAQGHMTGARRLGVWLLQTVIAAASAVLAVFALGKHP